MASRTRLTVVAAIVIAMAAVVAGSAVAAISAFTLNPKGILSADRTRATLSGTITCDTDDQVQLILGIEEVAGRILRTAQATTEITCTGTEQQWSATLFNPFALPLVPGIAEATAIVNDLTDSDSRIVNTRVRLIK